MEYEIWRNLPEQILETIFTKLPVGSLVRFRCVSKTWKSLLFSPSFTSLCSNTQRPWLLTFNKHDQHRICGAYDTFRQKWHVISLAFLPYQRHRLQLFAACSQLLCFTNFGDLLICNPLTKRWRSLTPPVNSSNYIQASRPVIAMASLAADEDIIMIVANYKATIYDSKLDRWITNIDLVPRSDLRSEAIFCRGSFYFTTWEPIEVVAFNFGESPWSTMEAPAPQECLTFARLVSCRERVILVGGIGSDGISKSLCFWELDASMKWREIERAPEMVSKAFFSSCYHNYDHIYCFGHGEFVCMSYISWPEILICDLLQSTWQWVPPCPMLPNMTTSSFRWISFVPSLKGLL